MPVLTATKAVAVPRHPATVTRPAAFAARDEAADAPAIAVLLFGASVPERVVATVRGFRTILPRAELFFYHDGRRPELAAAAERAGAACRLVPARDASALLRRMFVEVDADIFILVEGDDADPSLAPLIVDEIEGGTKDFVNVTRLRASVDPQPDVGERLLGWTADFLFGRGGTDLLSGYKACSRRFARSYPADPGGLDAALTLTLHALKLRMPIGEVAALGRAGPQAVAPGPGPWSRVRLVARLLVEERPRRVFGLAGLAVLALGVAVALPFVEVESWHATLPLRPATGMALGLIGLGAALGLWGTVLDVLAHARQEVKRLGYLAIPRRAERA